MKAGLLGRIVGAILVGVGVGLLVHYAPTLDSVDYESLTKEELLERLRGEATPLGESIAIGLGFMGFALLIIEFFGYLFRQIAGSVTPPPPPDDLPSLADDNF